MVLTKKDFYIALYNNGDLLEDEIDFVRGCRSVEEVISKADEQITLELIALDPKFARYLDISHLDKSDQISLISSHPGLFQYFNTEDWGSQDWLTLILFNPDCHVLCDMYLELSCDDVDTLIKAYPELEASIVGTIYNKQPR